MPRSFAKSSLIANPASVLVRRWRRARKLTDEQVRQIRALPWERGSTARFAREFGVSQALVSNIRNGLTYKADLPQQTYYARVTDGQERYSLGAFKTPEAAQNAIDKFHRTNKWPRGAVYQEKGKFRARLSLGVYETRWAAETANAKAIAKLKEQRV